MSCQTGLDLLFLLQGFHESSFQTIGMLGFECLLNITRYALFADNLRVLADWTVLKSGISSFTLFFPFPNRGEVDFALSTAIRLLW